MLCATVLSFLMLKIQNKSSEHYQLPETLPNIKMSSLERMCYLVCNNGTYQYAMDTGILQSVLDLFVNRSSGLTFMPNLLVSTNSSSTQLTTPLKWLAAHFPHYLNHTSHVTRVCSNLCVAQITLLIWLQSIVRRETETNILEKDQIRP
jgi:hypothetical protein